MKKKYLALALIIIAVVLLMSGCAAENPYTNTPLQGKVYGFWAGIWDGIIVVPAFIINLIGGKGGAFYNVYNNGGWYNFGFILGASFFGGGVGITHKARKNSDD